MPPDASSCYPLVTPLIQLRQQNRHRSVAAKKSCSCKYYQGSKRMKVTRRKLIPVMVFILVNISVIRLLKITIAASSSSPRAGMASTPPQQCTPSSPACGKVPLHKQVPATNQAISSAKATALTKKEFLLLSNLVSHRAPCNLLVFGLEPQYLVLSSINANGTTIFLEDNPEKLTTARIISNSTRIYKVEYNTTAKEAYKLLKHARQSPACAPHSGPLERSDCQLALTRLPREVYEREWDMVVVDGPNGDAPDAPGRMASIYTAGMIARAGNTANVIVHDVDRLIEKWFSWEFLCDENLVSSKGKLWNFRIEDRSNSPTFCPAK